MDSAFITSSRLVDLLITVVVATRSRALPFPTFSVDLRCYVTLRCQHISPLLLHLHYRLPRVGADHGLICYLLPLVDSHLTVRSGCSAIPVGPRSGAGHLLDVCRLFQLQTVGYDTGYKTRYWRWTLPIWLLLTIPVGYPCRDSHTLASKPLIYDFDLLLRLLP